MWPISRKKNNGKQNRLRDVKINKEFKIAIMNMFLGLKEKIDIISRQMGGCYKEIEMIKKRTQWKFQN